MTLCREQYKGARRYGISPSVQRNIPRVIAANHWDIELSAQPSNRVLFCLLSIYIFLTRKSPRNSRFKKRTRCCSFTALKRASDVPSVNWLSQTDVKNYFARVVIHFFLAVEIPLKHSSLCNKYIETEKRKKGRGRGENPSPLYPFSVSP